MNKLLLSLLFAIFAVNASSQRVYFVYLQSEQEQPFFVRLNEKVYSSSASGYLILSKLRDSTYNLSVGFPQSQAAEQKFTITVRAKDYGYLLKNFGEKGWGLFDLQTLAVQMAPQNTVKETTSNTRTEVSEFTNILAKAADDSSLREKPVMAKIEEKKPQERTVIIDTVVAKKEEPKPELKESVVTKPAEAIEKPVIKTEPPVVDTALQAVVKTEEPKKEVVETVQVKNVETRTNGEDEYKQSLVTRRSESSTTEGFGLTFIDQLSNGTKDTITILIPNPKTANVQVKELPKEEKKFLDISSDTAAVVKPVQSESKKEETIAEIKQTVADTIALSKQPSSAGSNNCKVVAEEADFLKLRKGMAAAETDDDMLDEARKYFKTKCFTTAQIKNLSVLFLNEAGKYRFFDLAYSYVSDANSFSSLQAELKEEYYINRFKAMLREM